MATCYYPDGNTWTAGWPCWNTTNPNDYAPCCANQNYCFSNGWCMSGNDMKPYRGGCTDRSWKSDSCNKKCTGKPIGGIQLCAEGGAACQATDCGTSNTFTISPGTFLLAGPAATSVVSVYNQAYHTAASASSTQSVATTMTSANASSPSRYSAGTLAGVGVGIGVPLLLALLAVLFLLFKERKKNKYLGHIPLTQNGQEKHGSDGKSELHATTGPVYDSKDAEYRNTPQYVSYEIDGSHPRRAELSL